jgi:hypothetical protein
MKPIDHSVKILADQYNAMVSKPQDRLDAGEVAFLAQALEDMRAKVYEDVYPMLKARRFIPVATDIDPGAETFAYEEQRGVGSAKVIANYADDPPSVDVSSTKVILPIVGIGDSYSYSIQDIRRAAKAGSPLPSRKATEARRAWERGLDTIGASGHTDTGLGGFINNANVAAASATTGAWDGGVTTTAQILADLNLGSRTVITQSDENFQPNTVLMPVSQFLYLSQTVMSSTDPRTVLQAFLASNPWITEVAPWDVLAGAGSGATDRAIYYWKDPEVCELIVPQEFEILPPQAVNYAFKVLCHGRTGGTAVYRPLGMYYQDGV